MDIYDPIGKALGLPPFKVEGKPDVVEFTHSASAFAGKKHTEETKKLLSDMKKGKLLGDDNPSRRAEVREKLSKPRKKWGKPKEVRRPLKGRTYEEIHGKEKADYLKKLRSARKGHKVTNFKKPDKKECFHCHKLYDPGNLKKHLTRLSIQVDCV